MGSDATSLASLGVRECASHDLPTLPKGPIVSDGGDGDCATGQQDTQAATVEDRRCAERGLVYCISRHEDKDAVDASRYQLWDTQCCRRGPTRERERRIGGPAAAHGRCERSIKRQLSRGPDNLATRDDERREAQ